MEDVGLDIECYYTVSTSEICEGDWRDWILYVIGSRVSIYIYFNGGIAIRPDPGRSHKLYYLMLHTEMK